MKLVRFGSCVINFDNVCNISISSHTITIYFNTPHAFWADGEGRLEQEFVQLSGSDVIAFEQWLDDNSDDARAPMDDPTDYISADACRVNNI